MAEDMLTELYAWDSEIEDVSALAVDDPNRDEDKAEDAYEKIIHAASGDDANDVVLSLAAQLLHKHFFHFPHVQLNVVDVLLKLCGSKRSQAVRIHTLRALLQIVKTPPATAVASTPTSAAVVAHNNTRMWMLRIEENVTQMLETEKSSVILRQVTPLRQALEERLQLADCHLQNVNSTVADKSNNQTSPSERSRKKLRDEIDATGGNDGDAASERETKKLKLDEEASKLQINMNEGKIVQLNRGWSNGRENGSGDLLVWKKQTSNDRIVENEGRRSKFSAQSPRNCPPCPYLFLGSLPRHTPSTDIVEFLLPIWPEIDIMKVQIKEPDFNANAYAFVSMPTIEHARLAIHYVNGNKFRGRTFLNANFARGPPVDTLLFVERMGDNVRMEDKDAVRDFDFTKCDPEVWDGLCQQLEQFGPLAFAEKGCVRFRNVEHAKAAIRKQLFTVMGYSILPVYDIKEQFAIDSTRRGLNVHKKQGFALKSGRLVGGDADCRGNKSVYYREDDDLVDGLNGRREHARMMSVKYSERSPPRSDRGNIRGRSRSPKMHHSGGHYTGFSKERRAPRSRSHSPVMQLNSAARDNGYGTLSDKENRRELRSSYGLRSPSPIEIRSHEESILVEEIRGQTHGRGGSWMEPRSTEDSRERRDLREEGHSRRDFRRVGSPSPSSSSRRSRKHESGKSRLSYYRHDLEDVRQSYRRDGSMRDGRGRMQSSSPGSALQIQRSHSRSPPRLLKYGGSSTSRPRSRSQSPNVDRRIESSRNQRSGGYRRHGERPIGSQLPDERLSLQPERLRYADERSIAEVARDEQQERQRFFQQQNQGRRDFHDADLSRYGSGSAIGQGGGGRGEKHHAHQFRGARDSDLYRQELAPPQHRSLSPLPPSAHHRSASPPPQDHRHPPTPLQTSQHQRESFGRERREEIAPRGRKSKFSPSRSPALHGIYNHRREGPSDSHEFDPEADSLGDRNERRRHSRYDRSRDERDHRSHHRDLREIRSSRPERSLTPSPIHHEHASTSSGRKSSGHSPHRSFNRRNESDNGLEDASGGIKQSRSKSEGNVEPQQMDMKNEGSRMARDELFAGMDDLTVDYEEDDE